MGKIYQINLKPETEGQRGIPKIAAPFAVVLYEGLDGDFNRYRTERKGRDPDQAVLLLPLETIQDLNREGWAVKPGDLGENITTEGIPYGDLSPGRIVSLGRVGLQITKQAKPCDVLRQLPYVGDRVPEFIRTLLGRRGVYTRVLTGGLIVKDYPVDLI